MLVSRHCGVVQSAEIAQSRGNTMTGTNSRRGWYGMLTLALLIAWLGVSRTAAQPPAQPTAERLQGLWADLASEEESKASRAHLLLTATPKETVAFLREHLKPVKVDAERVAKLVAELDDPKFPKRE